MVVTTVATIIACTHPIGAICSILGALAVVITTMLPPSQRDDYATQSDQSGLPEVQGDHAMGSSALSPALIQGPVVVRERTGRTIRPHTTPPITPAVVVPGIASGKDATHQAIRRKRAALRAGREDTIPMVRGRRQP
ncbi:hypothetical protein [Stomatohabitans albus]|uniref:hypothetical protein n=1 Tax=Stomatohabitans albus TaxID=3110766 RepID=UPI00300D24AE